MLGKGSIARRTADLLQIFHLDRFTRQAPPTSTSGPYTLCWYDGGVRARYAHVCNTLPRAVTQTVLAKPSVSIAMDTDIEENVTSSPLLLHTGHTELCATPEERRIVESIARIITEKIKTGNPISESVSTRERDIDTQQTQQVDVM